MAVEDSQAPGGHHQQSGAGEEDAHERNGELPFSSVEPVSNHVYQQRRDHDSDNGQHRGDQREDRQHRARYPARFLFCTARQKVRVNRNERGGKYAFAKEILQYVGNAKGGAPGIGRAGQPAQITREEIFPCEPGKFAKEHAGDNERSCASPALRLHGRHLRQDRILLRFRSIEYNRSSCANYRADRPSTDPAPRNSA